MRYEYDPAFIELAAFLAARRDPTTERRFRRALEPIYATEDARRRDEQFKAAAAVWFARLSLDAPLRLLICERPLIGQRVDQCVVVQAPGHRRQGVELFARTSDDGSRNVWTLAVQICPDTLLNRQQLGAILRGELLKVADMLDDQFGYSPDLPAMGRVQENLVRDRYRALWDVYVGARLLREAQLTADVQHILRDRFLQAFTVRGAAPPAPTFDAMMYLSTATHAQLLEWAGCPSSMPGWTSSTQDANAALGQECPICRFPTYDWCPLDSTEHADCMGVIQSTYPAWRIQHGICRQCVETVLAHHEQSTQSRRGFAAQVNASS